ncbi:MAG: AAA family ATPase [Rhodobacteraceae bacterium]|nr:AAA family ATPase [Paracoccaceae bacterium]
MEFNVVVQNCNSIDRADLKINKGALNIKYGANGLGKSTIARAIVAKVKADDSLSLLMPFKSRGNATAAPPSVSGIDEIKSSLVFDEDYVNQFVFQQDEVVKNSFDIFIKTPEYVATMEEIEKLFSGIKKAFTDNPNIEQAIKDLKELRDTFGSTSKDGSIPKTSKFMKSYGYGNKVENIPEKLKPFEPFIKSPEPSKWIAWQIDGNNFLELGDTCPYCATTLSDVGQREMVLAVEKEYDAKAVGHLNTIKTVIERLGKYFSAKCQENLEKLTKAKIELGAEDKSFLSGLRTDIDALIQKLEGLRTISFFALRDVDEISDKILMLKIDLGMIDKLNSEETQAVINPINTQLNELIKQVGTLKGNINKHKARIKKAIEKNQSSINNFLKFAGYKYHVVITAEPETYKMKLVHRDMSEHISAASKHLSYGERNAFALVLFVHQVLSENPDIVILDDPISSFDKNKKFAILHQLFKGEVNLKGRTTVMLTHDIEPVIDMIKSTARVFEGAKPSAFFLSSRAGIVSEQPIEKDDIQTFARVCKDVISAQADSIIRSIYLRRHYEIVDDKGLEYNMLASLFKKRDVPYVYFLNSPVDMEPSEKAKAQTKIKEDISDFDYDALVCVVKDDVAMRKKYTDTTVGYEKIQLFRIIHEQHDNHIITKFINESYHIENEYIMQLNPQKFEIIPEYVIDECNKLLAKE